jgi:ParB-like chromosome segregation protein Spo0J
MLRTVAVKNMRPNPFRCIDEYPLQEEKIEALKDSIESTGFWGTIVARPAEGKSVEIAFGHHRREALIQSKVAEVEIIVRELTNEQMLQMMARENMEEWGTSAWVEVETVRAAIDAYGKDLISIPLDKGKGGNQVLFDAANTLHHPYAKCDSRNSLNRPYTKTSVARFLGWTDKRTGGRGTQPNDSCLVAFKALAAIEKGWVTTADLRKLNRMQMATLLTEQESLHKDEMRQARDRQRIAEESEKRAEIAATTQQKDRFKQQAKEYQEQAKAREAEAKRKAIELGKKGAEAFRGGAGVGQVKDMAESQKSLRLPKAAIHTMDDFGYRTVAKLQHLINNDDTISADFVFLKRNREDLSDDVSDSIAREIHALIDRLADWQEFFATEHRGPSSRRTGAHHAYEAIEGPA